MGKPAERHARWTDRYKNRFIALSFEWTAVASPRTVKTMDDGRFAQEIGGDDPNGSRPPVERLAEFQCAPNAGPESGVLPIRYDLVGM